MIRHRSQAPFLLLLPAYYLVVCLYTFFGIFVWNYAVRVPYDWYSKVTYEYVKLAIFYIILSAFCYILGWKIASIISRKMKAYHVKEYQKTRINISKEYRLVIYILGVALAIFYVLAYGVEGLYERRSYTGFYNDNDTRNNFLLKIHFLFFPLISLLIAFIKMPLLRYSALTCNALVLLAASTRLLGLLFFVYALGRYIRNGYPAEFIYQNLQIQNNIIHAAHMNDVQKLLFLGSSCIYPRQVQQPMREDALLTGTLEPTNEPYAIAKIAGIKMCESYNRQYGRAYRSVMPTNLYGPGDNYHPENSHVARELIGFECNKTLDDICSDTWNWITKNPSGYDT